MTEFEGTQAGPDKPLVTIDFESLQKDSSGEYVRLNATRHWHHVPRLHEVVELSPEGLSGRVLNVIWYDNHVSIGMGG